jgi:hypothetical protein
MTDQVAILAEIRPGKRAELVRLLAQGPPFDLEDEGFEHHEVFLGDTDIVFVFTGPGAAAQLQRLASTPDLARRMMGLSEVVAAPRVLQQTFEWQRTG